MSKTPRTIAAIERFAELARHRSKQDAVEGIAADMATLERELSAVTAERDALLDSKKVDDRRYIDLHKKFRDAINPRNAEASQLRAELAAREAEVVRLLELNEHRTITAEQKAASDKRLRINDLAAQYAPILAAPHANLSEWVAKAAVNARALAAAVVEAEE